MSPLSLVLTLISGIAWTIVYLDAIRVGFRDRTYAMPLAALGLNFAWETIYAAYGVGRGLSAQALINVGWALADAVIVVTFFRFGRTELPRFLTAPLFVAWGVLVLATSYAVQLLLIGQFGFEAAGRYAAFLQNLLMSGLFIAMFVERGGLRGQSLVIAVAKWIGTLAPTILFGALHRSALILGLGLMCSVLDLIYIGLILLTKPSNRRAADGTAQVTSAAQSPSR